MEVLKKIEEKLPAKADVTEVYYEGPLVVIYSKNPSALDNETVKGLVREFKKRIEVRPDSSILFEPSVAEKLIREIIPEEANITDLSFIPDFNKVIIEAEKPGLVIGKAGSTLMEIKGKALWLPEVKRTPIIPSKIIKTIRQTLIAESKDRREFFKKMGKKIHEKVPDDIEWIRLTSLGGFREVGRSAILVRTPNSNILMDCGVNVASNDKNAFPFLTVSEFQIKDLDAVVITHAHLDHSGFVPYLYKYQYEGPVYCTAPTRDLMTLLQLDYVDVAQKEGKAVPYSKKDVKTVIKHTMPLQWSEVTDITPDTKLTLYNSGHILGASIAHLHIGDGLHNLVYTGDLKYAPSRLLERAHNDFLRVETLILESTYGGNNDYQPPRRDAENELVQIINNTFHKGGKVLVPVLGVGRAQELMVFLDECFQRKEIEGLKVYIDGMIWDATAIHTAYPEFMSRRIINQIFRKSYNPFTSEIFQRVGSQEEREQIIKGNEPCVLLATSGMLTGGPSVEYLRRLCDNPENSMVFVSYQGEGTLGKRIQKGWKEVAMSNGKGKLEEIKINMGVHTLEGFSGHSDRRQLMAYVMHTHPKPERIIIDHGEKTNGFELSAAFRRNGIDSLTPQNLETIRLR